LIPTWSYQESNSLVGKISEPCRFRLFTSAPWGLRSRTGPA